MFESRFVKLFPNPLFAADSGFQTGQSALATSKFFVARSWQPRMAGDDRKSNPHHRMQTNQARQRLKDFRIRKSMNGNS